MLDRKLWCLLCVVVFAAVPGVVLAGALPAPVAAAPRVPMSAEENALAKIMLYSPYELQARPTMLHRGPQLYELQQGTVPTLDTEAIMESVNDGVAYGFEFATAFTPLITIIIGFAVAGAIIGVLFALGLKIARMIKKAL